MLSAELIELALWLCRSMGEARKNRGLMMFVDDNSSKAKRIII